MNIEKIGALDVYWYVTQDGVLTDSPERVRKKILRTFGSVYGRMPKWNGEEGE